MVKNFFIIVFIVFCFSFPEEGTTADLCGYFAGLAFIGWFAWMLPPKGIGKSQDE